METRAAINSGLTVRRPIGPLALQLKSLQVFRKLARRGVAALACAAGVLSAEIV